MIMIIIISRATDKDTFGNNWSKQQLNRMLSSDGQNLIINSLTKFF